MINFTAVMVTYADRALLVKQVVDACVSVGCNSVFIIDNGSAVNSKKELKAIQEKYSFVNVVVNEKNLGSAVAFSQGMDLAMSDKNPNGNIIFLDDDNVAVDNAIQSALKVYQNEEYDNSVFYLYRKDRPHYVKYVETGDESILIGKPNSFMTFTMGQYIKDVFKLKKNASITSKKINSDNIQLVPVPCGPYGGMLTSKSILAQGVRPYKDMFVYFDDTDYSIRLRMEGIKLYLITSSILTDIDDSWTNEKLQSKCSSPFLEGADYKVRYSIRNRIYFERKYLVENVFCYAINISGLLAINFIKAVLTFKVNKFIKLISYILEGFQFSKVK